MVKILIVLSILTTLCVNGMMMTGGWSKVKNINSPEMQRVGKVATQHVSASTNSLHHLKLANITSARQQVVSGINYMLTIVAGPTECKKNIQKENFNIEECKFLDCEAPTICDVIVWVRSWIEDGTKVTKSTCRQGKKTC